jgi:predicted amidohydrolase
MPILGIAQMTASDDKLENFRTVSRLVSEAARQRVDLLSLPECFLFIGARAGAARDAGESLDGPLVAQYCGLAKESGMWLSLGGLHESGGDGGRVFNTHLMVDASGKIRACYRKTHLFDVDTPNGRFHESQSTAPGEELVLCRNTPIGAVGLSVCYDLRFPDVYTQLRKAGADVILVPSAFMPGTGLAHWEVLLRARAIETQCYVGAAAQCGKHSDYRSSYGHAFVVDPWGTVLADAGPSTEGVVTVNIDAEFIEQTRRRMPVMSHRREGLYSKPVYIAQ